MGWQRGVLPLDGFFESLIQLSVNRIGNSFGSDQHIEIRRNIIAAQFFGHGNVGKEGVPLFGAENHEHPEYPLPHILDMLADPGHEIGMLAQKSRIRRGPPFEGNVFEG